MCLHTCMELYKIPRLIHIIEHVTATGFGLCHSPLYRTKDKFCNSCIKQQWTVQYNFYIDVQLHVPQMFYQLPYIPNRKIQNACKICQLLLPIVSGVMCRSASARYLTATYILAIKCCGHGYCNMAHWCNTHKQHSHPDIQVHLQTST
jgi:hypothetical protein